MKKLTSTLALTALLASPTYADVIFAAPGMDEAQSYEGLNIQSGYSTQKKIEIKDYWSYEITGINWQLSAGTPFDGQLGSNGKLETKWGTAYPGASTLQLSDGNSWLVSNAQFNHGTNPLPQYLTDKNSGSISFATPKSYPPHPTTGKNLTFDLRQVTNMNDDGGSYVQVHGVAIKSAPAPYGSLTVTSHVNEGGKPTVNWLMGREDATGTAPTIPSSTVNWTPTITPGDSTSSPSVSGCSTKVKNGKCSKATNCGVGKTNNGHGNNIDGVDSSNPGKSGQNFGDPSGSYDDEGKGGGAAPSKKGKKW